MIPLRVPVATVEFKTNKMATKSIPIPKEASIVITKIARHRTGHGMHFELPSDRLRPGLHLPQSKPDLLFEHCASDPFGRFRFIVVSVPGAYSNNQEGSLDKSNSHDYP